MAIYSCNTESSKLTLNTKSDRQSNVINLRMKNRIKGCDCDLFVDITYPTEFRIPPETRRYIFKSRDSIRYVDYSTEIPRSEYRVVNAYMNNKIAAYKVQFSELLNESIANFGYNSVGSSFRVDLKSVFEDQFISGYLLEHTFYVTPASHGMSYAIPVNFDRGRNRIVDFEDYFLVPTEKDTAEFVQLIKCGIGMESLILNSLKNQKFNVDSVSVYFYFDPYEIASYAHGSITVRIKKQKLRKWINEEFLLP